VLLLALLLALTLQPLLHKHKKAQLHQQQRQQ
jgi:hypothetical protein